MWAVSHESSLSPAARGALAASGSFLLWGLVPIYWKQMHAVPAIELIAHRIVWSLLLLVIVLAVQKKFGELRTGFLSKRSFALNLAASVLLAANWTIYVWAVNAGHILEASLGYFLAPLGNVTVGYLLLHEQLRRAQWLAIVVAATGVLSLLFGLGTFPWIALSLAGSWSGYALLKKQSSLGPMAGLTMETLLLFPFAAALLLWRHHTGEGALGRVDFHLHLLVLSVGIVTAVPLILFAYGARRIRLVTLGLLQYLTPTIQFLIGLLVYRETFSAVQFNSYALIWTALIIYTADAFWSQRHRLQSTAT